MLIMQMIFNILYPDVMASAEFPIKRSTMIMLLFLYVVTNTISPQNK